MHAYHEAARPVRLLAALAAGTAVVAALAPGRPGRWSRAAAATAAGALVGRWLARPLSGPGGRPDDGAGPARPAEDGRDELRLWVAAADPGTPAADPLSRCVTPRDSSRPLPGVRPGVAASCGVRTVSTGPVRATAARCP